MTDGGVCESMMKKERLDKPFFEDETVVPSVTVFSYEAATREEIGFKKFEAGDRKKEVAEAKEKIAPKPPEEKMIWSVNLEVTQWRPTVCR